jgi:hypothetical protein
MAQGNLLLNIAVKNQAALGKVNQQLTTMQASSLKLSTLLKGAGGALAAIGATKLIGSIVSTTARFEDLGDALASVTGSAQAGAEAFDFVSNFATQTQFGVEDLTTTFIKLKASGIEPTKDLLTLFTDTAAITTDQIGSLQAMTDLFSRTTSGGLGLEELNRLADRGVPVFRILEEQLGLSRLEISNVGKTAEGAKKILNALSTGIRADFGGATARVTDNLSTQFSNFSIALKNTANTFGQGLSPVLKDVTLDLTTFIEENDDLVKSLGIAVGGALKLFITALGTVAKAIMVVVDALVTAGTAVSDFLGKVRDLIPFLRKTESVQNDNVKSLRAMHDAYENTGASVQHYTDAIMRNKGKVEEAEKVFKHYDDAILRTERSNKEAAESAEKLNELFENNVILEALNRTIGEGFTPLEGKIQAVAAGMGAFQQTASSALTDVFMGTKTLKDALGEIAEATLRALIQGFINLGLTIFILEPLEKFLRRQVQQQDKLNSKLRTEIALRTVLAFLTGGTSIGLPGMASGGPVAANQPYIVGERGRELFIPNSSGTIIPNDELNSPGSFSGSGRGDNIEVTFNINTIDATDFDQLLTTRQDLIVGLINRGLAERGKRSLTA